MRASCRIFTKISGYIPFINIKMWCEYDVIWTLLMKVMTIFVFSPLIWKYIGKSYLPPTKKPYLHFYTCKLHQNRTECVKLNYIKSQKSAGLRPAPIKRKLSLLKWLKMHFNHPPWLENFF